MFRLKLIMNHGHWVYLATCTTCAWKMTGDYGVVRRGVEVHEHLTGHGLSHDLTLED